MGDNSPKIMVQLKTMNRLKQSIVYSDLKMNIFKTILSDIFIFSILQISFLCILFYAIIKEIKGRNNNSSVQAIVKRGEKSIDKLHLAYGIGSVVVLQLINISNAYTNYKVFISLINILILSYLCYFNSWFRNRIMRFMGSISIKEEKFK